MATQTRSTDLARAPYRLTARQVERLIAAGILPETDAAGRVGGTLDKVVKQGPPHFPRRRGAGTLPGLEVDSWYGVFAPAGTPPAIIRKLNAEFTAALNMPDVKALLATDGSEVVASSPERFGAIIRAEYARWAPVVKESGAKID